MTRVIEARDLSKAYGDVQAVDHVTLAVEKGALFGLLGPNGSGKTTMIKMLTGQTRPTGGTASVLGIDVVKDPVGVRERVGIIPEQETPPSFLTSMEYLKFVAAIRKIPDIETKADWWFDFLDFADKKDVLCKDLSRGTRQKLMFTQAFIHEPTLALIDEPLINFDPIMQDLVKDYLADYVKEGQDHLHLNPYPRGGRGDLFGVCDPPQGETAPHRARCRPEIPRRAPARLLPLARPEG